MSWILLLIVQMLVGALIGGLTNELAIRMLFRPYKPVFLWGWRVPFTPGLIPKRHQELAKQMGQLVENFLITPEGIRAMLKKGKVEQEVAGWIHVKVQELADSEVTVHDLLSRIGLSLTPELKTRLKPLFHRYLLNRLNSSYNATLEELIPATAREEIEEKLPMLAPVLLGRIGQYVTSSEGEQMIRQMLSQLANGLGMFGGLAGMFLSDEKVISKVASSLEEALNSKAIEQKVGELLVLESRRLFQKRLDEIVQWVGSEQLEGVIDWLFDQVVDVQKLGDLKVNVILKPLLPSIQEAIPPFVHKTFEWAEKHLERGLKKINLTEIAAAQVEGFPVHRLEDMIVSITGKELKMITVFGAILGALIGAFQAVLVTLIR